MCPAEVDRTHLIYCHYLEIVTLREEEKLNRTLFASDSCYENVSSCRCEIHCLMEQAQVVAVEVSISISVILSHAKRLSTGNYLNLKRNMGQISRPVILKAEKSGRKQRGKEGARVQAAAFLFPPPSQVSNSSFTNSFFNEQT